MSSPPELPCDVVSSVREKLARELMDVGETKEQETKAADTKGAIASFTKEKSAHPLRLPQILGELQPACLPACLLCLHELFEIDEYLQYSRVFK